MSYNALDAAASLQDSLAQYVTEKQEQPEDVFGASYPDAITEFEEGFTGQLVSFWLLGSGESMRVTVEQVRPWGGDYDVPDWKYVRPDRNAKPERNPTHELLADGSLRSVGEGENWETI